jgi:predicted DsbA family dithiol-disulfide isomerase
VRLADLADELGDDIITIEWRSFLLRPEPEDRPLEAFTRYTEKWARPAEMEPRATFNTWSGRHEPPSHSLPSSVAGKVAGTFGPEAERAFHERLFPAYFTENRTISDRGVLLDVAGEAGLDAAEFDRRWDAEEAELTKQVWRDYATAVQSGIQGVPAVVVNRRWLIPGAVDVEEYRRAVAHAREHPEGEDGTEGATEPPSAG